MSQIQVVKMRKLSWECSPTSSSEQDKNSLINFDHLPLEVLEMILRFLPYRDIAGCVRLISKKCCSVATMILNSAFVRSGARLRATMAHLEQAKRTGTSECKMTVNGRARNYLEYVQAQYELLRAVVWRYTHPPGRPPFERLCFYPGAILDELDGLLRLARTRPAGLLGKDGPALCITGFAALCKKFMNYFEKVSERKLNSKNTMASGCKLVDLLDCLLCGREVLSLRMSAGRHGRTPSVSMRLRYVMQRSWFTCLTMPGTSQEEDSWFDQQRFMYLRLRRLVGSVNEHHLEQLHYEREFLMRDDTQANRPKSPSWSTYSGPVPKNLETHVHYVGPKNHYTEFGWNPESAALVASPCYGEYGGKYFFYYGNMNESAYECKVVDLWRMNLARDRKRKFTSEKKPCYDLIINVELKCSPEFAPLTVRSMMNFDELEEATLLNNNHQPDMYLKLSIFCPASVSNKLPSTFVWELRSPRQCRRDAGEPVL